jgi:hypothetical protein
MILSAKLEISQKTQKETIPSDKPAKNKDKKNIATSIKYRVTTFDFRFSTTVFFSNITLFSQKTNPN